VTQPELKREVQKWQRLLRLQDWNMSVICVDEETLGDEKLAEAVIDTRECTAALYIATANGDDDLCDTVVHEIVHVLVEPLRVFFERLTNDEVVLDFGDDLVEQVVSRIASCVQAQEDR